MVRLRDAPTRELSHTCTYGIERDGPEGSTMTINELGQARSEAFAEGMLGVLNDGALALMTTVSTMHCMRVSLAQGGED